MAGFFAALILFSSFSLVPLAAPQETGGRIRVESSLVLVDATVKDKSGRVIDGLTQNDFEVTEDGAQQTISHFSRDQLPLAVALVVDLSTSITPFLHPLRYATQTALRTLKPEDKVALFTFTHEVERRVDLTGDKRAISDEIETLSTGGSTNINGGIFEAARYLKDKAPAARRVIILVSDNVPTDRGEAGSREVGDAVLEADAPVFSLKIPGDNPLAARLASRVVGSGLVNVEKLAADTGGEIFDVQKEGSLYLAFEALIQRVKTRYTIGYAPTHAERNGRFRTLTVRLAPSHGAAGKDYKVIAKRGYFAPRS
jgi:Ca-activated chloride channel family protein